MEANQDLLQARLEELEAGVPVQTCLVDLPEQEAELLRLAAALQALPMPVRNEAVTAVQRANLLHSVEAPPAASSPWQGLRAWWTARNPFDRMIVYALSPALFLLLFALFSMLFSQPQTAGVEDEAPAAIADVETTAVPGASVSAAPTTAATVETATAVPAEAAAPEQGPQQVALRSLQGVVTMQDGSGAWTAVANDTLLQVGQYIRTGPLSTVTLAFYDGSRAMLGPNSELRLDAVNAGAVDAPRVIAMSQWAGTSQHAVVSSSEEGARYEVRTPSALGTAKGTEFTVELSASLETRITVDEGAVAVTGQESTVVAVAGQTTAVMAGEEPIEPAFVVTGEGEVTQVGDTWLVAGQAFATHAGTVIVGNPQVGDVVFVRGHLAEDGTAVADLINLLRRAPENSFAFTGLVESMGETWTIAGFTVLTNEETAVAEGIEVGTLVHVTGVIQAEGSFLALTIQPVAAGEDEPFAFTGVVQAMGTGWTVSGVAVTLAEDAEVEEGIAVGDLVKVEGVIIEAGVWEAHEIKLLQEPTPTFAFVGTVDAVEPWQIAGIAIVVNEWTEIDETIVTGDRVQVEGIITETGEWLASEIKLVEDTEVPDLLTFTGTVGSTEPWQVSGIALVTDENSAIDPTIGVGDRVQVQALLQADGSLLVLSITLLTEEGAGCVSITSVVVALTDNQVTLLDGSTIALTEDIVVIGALEPGAVVVVLSCVDENGNTAVTSITVIFILDTPPATPTPEPTVAPTAPPPPSESDGEQVTLCHKPNGKNPHTISVAETAVSAHLGHGDTLGACP